MTLEHCGGLKRHQAYLTRSLHGPLTKTNSRSQEAHLPVFGILDPVDLAGHADGRGAREYRLFFAGVDPAIP